jgi:hypothetical protein
MLHLGNLRTKNDRLFCTLLCPILEDSFVLWKFYLSADA